MRFSMITASELRQEHLGAWLRLQRSNPLLASPYFCHEFTLGVASVRDDVRITLMEEGHEVVGFFPFQRGRFGAGRPVGGVLSDYHGVIASPHTTWNVKDLLRESHLAFWEFDHLVAAQTPFAPYHRREAISPALDLSSGFASYVKRHWRAGSSRIAQLERKARKLAREVGPMRFEAHSTGRDILARVFEWKSHQCRQIGSADFFARSWTRALVERILETQQEHFAGRLSALFAGDHLVAAHAGMRSERVLHWWFPVYNHAFAKYSPGGILLLKLAEEAAARGLEIVDLGKGDDHYKESFADHEIRLAEGCAWRRSLAASVHELHETTKRFLRVSPLTRPIRPALRAVKRWARQHDQA